MRRPPRLTAISRRRSSSSPAFADWLEALAAAGVDAVQIREKDLGDGALYALVESAVERIAGRCLVLVNGRADVAVAAGADGVHLPSNGIPVGAVRRRFGAGLLLGCSTHSIAEIDRARDSGADYVSFSPIFETPGKRPVGVEELARATGRGVPVVALGGITIDRLEAVAAAGASGASAIRMFEETGRLAAVVAAARRAFQT